MIGGRRTREAERVREVHNISRAICGGHGEKRFEYGAVGWIQHENDNSTTTECLSSFRQKQIVCSVSFTLSNQNHLHLRSPPTRKEESARAGSAPGVTIGSDAEALLCKSCSHPITRVDAAREVEDRHLHRCINPAGVTFQVRCFTDAPGCVGVGTADHSWFDGFAWQIALCGQCATHVGWRFSGTAGAFVGLIANRIVLR